MINHNGRCRIAPPATSTYEVGPGYIEFKHKKISNRMGKHANRGNPEVLDSQQYNRPIQMKANRHEHDDKQ